MQVVLSKIAEKHLKHRPKLEQSKVKKKLLLLADDPFSGKKLSGELEGIRSLRVWPYRIIYKINAVQKLVEVGAILHRQGAYK
ncbi:type II toxin-antitoxin system RelE/ParE family toxin [Candidatus Daviesbacteria bacterium]|nr:type II toxin-antitoxin system RelE/ParE family toxin [Candidatus Daviesbacteria bacterium]